MSSAGAQVEEASTTEAASGQKERFSCSCSVEAHFNISIFLHEAAGDFFGFPLFLNLSALKHLTAALLCTANMGQGSAGPLGGQVTRHT